jgi:hypothetical protein
MKARASHAFSLIEVVLALGVVAIALVGIFSLFSTSLRTNRETTDRQEGIDLHRVVDAGLRDTNILDDPQRFYAEIYSGAPGAQREYYIYTTQGVAGWSTCITNTTRPLPPLPLPGGILYHVSVTACSNISTNVFPVSGWADWPGLPVTVKIHSMPNISARGVLTNTPPVSVFDLIIPR